MVGRSERRSWHAVGNAVVLVYLAAALGRRIAVVVDRWGWPRIAALNAGVLLLTLPAGTAHALGWAMCGAAMAAFVALAVTALSIPYRSG